jgi:hypothetical protein
MRRWSVAAALPKCFPKQMHSIGMHGFCMAAGSVASVSRPLSQPPALPLVTGALHVWHALVC